MVISAERRILAWLALLCLALAACQSGLDVPLLPTKGENTPATPSEVVSPSPPPATATAPPTAEPPLVILLASSEAEATLTNELQSLVADLAQKDGLRFQIRQSLSTEDLTAAVRLVIVLPPFDGLTELVRSAPQTQFLAINFPGVSPATNLSLIAPLGMRPDQQGFLAGYIAAMITPEWRVGVLSTSDTTAGIAARRGFINGAIFFCGLCRQTYPPFYNYPLYAEMPSTSSAAEWQSAANTLVDRYVKTAYVFPGSGDEAVLRHLAEAGVHLIGGSSPPNDLRDQWVATIRPEVLPIVRTLWSDLLQGKGGASLPVTFEISDINPDLLSPGRENLARQFLQDLMSGFVDTGVDPLTGEER